MMRQAKPWLVLMVAVAYGSLGCDPQGGSEFKTAEQINKAPPTRPADDHDHDHHDHHHEPPHGGSLTMLGDHDGQIELVLDKGTGKLTAYALDGEAEKPVALEQGEIVLKIDQVGAKKPEKAAGLSLTLKGEKKEGAKGAEVFTGQLDALKGQETFAGSIEKVAFGPKKFDGVKLTYQPGHDDHDHAKHGDGDHAKHEDHDHKEGDKDHDHDKEKKPEAAPAKTPEKK
ncbi:MAG: hypothetical protein U0903_10385 [Planctomycetales bacterium]